MQMDTSPVNQGEGWIQLELIQQLNKQSAFFTQTPIIIQTKRQWRLWARVSASGSQSQDTCARAIDL